MHIIQLVLDFNVPMFNFQLYLKYKLLANFRGVIVTGLR